MPENKIYKEITLTTPGLSLNLPIVDIFNLYTITGTGVTLSGDVTISTADTPTSGVVFKILWNGDGLVKGANNITIFGYSLTAAQGQRLLAMKGMTLQRLMIRLLQPPKLTIKR